MRTFQPPLPLRRPCGTILISLSLLLWVSTLQAKGAPIPEEEAEIIRDPERRLEIICQPSRWYDLLFFFLFNFFAHVLTIQIRPGETTAETALSCFLVLLFPFAWLGKVYGNISLAPAFLGRQGDDLLRAKWAGALVMVVRGKGWKAEVGDIIDGVEIRRAPESGPWPTRPIAARIEEQGTQTPRLHLDVDWIAGSRISTFGLSTPQSEAGPTSEPQLMERDATLAIGKQSSTFPYPARNIKRPFPYIHGQFDLPEGYLLSEVPRHWHVRTANPDVPIRISASSNILKTCAAIGQLLFACVSLYRSRGNQLKQYGYAAYQLTVVPYALMSLLNLIAACIAPEYPMRYLVASDVMEEARRRGGVFEGVIGTLVKTQGTIGVGEQVESEMGLPLSERKIDEHLRSIVFEEAEETPGGGQRQGSWLTARLFGPGSTTNLSENNTKRVFTATSTSSRTAPRDTSVHPDDDIQSIALQAFDNHHPETHWIIASPHAKTRLRRSVQDPSKGPQKPRRPSILSSVDLKSIKSSPLLQALNSQSTPSEPIQDHFIIPPTSTYLATRPHHRYRYPTKLGLFTQSMALILFPLTLLTPYILIGIMTHSFSRGESTVLQRFWVLGWLVVNQCVGVSGVGDWIMGSFWRCGVKVRVAVVLGGLVLVGIAMGGMLVTGKIMWDGDVCTRI